MQAARSKDSINTEKSQDSPLPIEAESDIEEIKTNKPKSLRCKEEKKQQLLTTCIYVFKESNRKEQKDTK